MGLEFAAFRFLVSSPLPIIAGLISAHVPIETDPPSTKAS